MKPMFFEMTRGVIILYCSLGKLLIYLCYKEGGYKRHRQYIERPMLDKGRNTKYTTNHSII